MGLGKLTPHRLCSRIESPGHCTRNCKVQPTCASGYSESIIRQSTIMCNDGERGSQGRRRGEKRKACRTLTETLSTTQRDAERRSFFFIHQGLPAIIPSQPTPLPTVPSPFPRFRGLHSYLKRGLLWKSFSEDIMQWLDRSRWTTSPYYALVIFVIACGSIPKGMQLTRQPLRVAGDRCKLE